MVEDNSDSRGYAFTVSVDHIDVGTGVSARDRTTTVRSLASPGTMPDALRRPGHIFPLRARAGGVLERRGHTEAAVDLLRMAGLSGVGGIGEIVADDGSMRRGGALKAFPAEHKPPIPPIAHLVDHPSRQQQATPPVRSS